MTPDVERFRIRPGKLRLASRATQVADLYRDADDAREQLARTVQRIAQLQNLLYAGDSAALLLVFQAMDAAGKDSTIRHVLSGVNPQGCQVFSFKQPSATELEHDFLWRTTACLPERGRIGVFNRSYYEEVLVVRVHPELLAAQRLSPAAGRKRAFWQARYASIREFERHLQRNGTKVVKFFLHVSREEQRERFLKRLDDPAKNWKFSVGDVQERAHWPAYRRAYEDCIGATTSEDAPWYVVPADDKKNMHLIVARVIATTLEALRPAPPRLGVARREELQAARRLLSRRR
jgi:PPK2 family polyphosphate:nucleotide phosphotransferase